MSVKKTQGCPFCEKPIPAGGEHVCADPTKSFLTTHSCHEDMQQLQQAYSTDSDFSPRIHKRH